MKRYKAIVAQETEPNKEDIWLKDNKLYIFNGGWIPLTIGSEDQEQLASLVKDFKSLLGENDETTKIDTIKEIVQFLEGIPNNASLTSVLEETKKTILDDLSEVIIPISDEDLDEILK